MQPLHWKGHQLRQVRKVVHLVVDVCREACFELRPNLLLFSDKGMYRIAHQTRRGLLWCEYAGILANS